MRPTIRHIQETVAEHFGVPVSIMTARRGGPLPANEPRHVAMFLAREVTDRSCLVIARNFNRKNHTTVFHAHRKVKRLMAESDAFAEDIRALELVVGS